METKEIFGNASSVAASEKKETTKKTTKKTTAKATKTETKTTKTTKAAKTTKKEVKTDVFVQYLDSQVSEAEILKKVNADLKKQKVTATDIKLYIKPQDNACYYVANGKVAGQVALF